MNPRAALTGWGLVAAAAMASGSFQARGAPQHPGNAPSGKPSPPAIQAAPVRHDAAPLTAKPASDAKSPTRPLDGAIPALRVLIAPGPEKDAIKRILLAPYAQAAGIGLADADWDGSDDALAKRLADNTPAAAPSHQPEGETAPGLALVDAGALQAGCAAQTLQRLDWAALGRNRFLAGVTSDCGAGAFMSATVLAWDKDKPPAGQPPPTQAPIQQKPAQQKTSQPKLADQKLGDQKAGDQKPPDQKPGDPQSATTGTGKPAADQTRVPKADAAPDPGKSHPEADPQWGDFWDVAKHPGGRGLRRMARGNLEIALLADGVGPGDVYRVLRTADGVDRAFRKLDQLKPYLIWWTQPAEPAQLLGTGKVLYTSAPAESLAAPQPGSHAHIGVQWTGSLSEVVSWAVPKAVTGETAMLPILVATDPAREAELARATGYGPSTASGLALLPESLRAASPASPANLKAGLSIDEGFWQENQKTLEVRFIEWLAK